MPISCALTALLADCDFKLAWPSNIHGRLVCELEFLHTTYPTTYFVLENCSPKHEPCRPLSAKLPRFSHYRRQPVSPHTTFGGNVLAFRSGGDRE